MYGVPQQGQIDVTVAKGAMQFMIGGGACIEINGYPQQRPWGRWVFDMQPGMHWVRVWFPYIGMPHAGLATLQVPVHPFYATVVRYDTPMIMTSSGTLKMTGSYPMR
jgi:hypothetical protein